jgi:hypothetical protein
MSEVIAIMERGRVQPSPEVVVALRIGAKRLGLNALVSRVGCSWSPVAGAALELPIRPEHLARIVAALTALGLLPAEAEASS